MSSTLRREPSAGSNPAITTEQFVSFGFSNPSPGRFYVAGASNASFQLPKGWLVLYGSVTGNGYFVLRETIGYPGYRAQS